MVAPGILAQGIINKLEEIKNMQIDTLEFLFSDRIDTSYKVYNTNEFLSDINKIFMDNFYKNKSVDNIKGTTFKYDKTVDKTTYRNPINIDLLLKELHDTKEYFKNISNIIVKFNYVSELSFDISYFLIDMSVHDIYKIREVLDELYSNQLKVITYGEQELYENRDESDLINILLQDKRDKDKILNYTEWNLESILSNHNTIGDK